MDNSTLRQELLELLILLTHLNPVQFKAICQFVQITPQPKHEAYLPQLLSLLQRASPDQVTTLRNLIKRGEEGSSSQELQNLAVELSVDDCEELKGAFTLLSSLHQLQRLLQSLSILQLMKMFEIMPPGPPVQQLQLLQQIQQLFTELKPEALLNLHKKLEEAQPGKEQQTLIGLLNLSSEFFQLYQPLRLLLQLDADELNKLKNVLPQLEPQQILQLLQLLQLQPFDVLELRNLLHPNDSNQQESQNVQTTVVPQPSISQTPMDSMDPDGGDKLRADLHLQIVEQPPEKSVYKRNLKPNPIVMLVGDQKLNDGNLYIVPTLVRCDTFAEEPKYLTGNRPVRVASGRVLTFRKLKITTTSHQQQETLFCIKFELRKYSGDDEYTILDSVHSSPICVLSHSTQMKPAPSVTSVIAEVVPSVGGTEGGTRVAILGSNFVDTPAARVRFDSTDVMPTFHGPGTLLCYTPQHSPGTVAVRVSNSPKKWSESHAAFTYHDYTASVQNTDQVVIPLSPGHHFEGMSGDWPSASGFDAMKDDSLMGSMQLSSMDSRNVHYASLDGTINSLDLRGYSALHYTSSVGDLNGTRLLVERGAFVDVKDKNGNTSLYWACVEDQGPMVEYLLQKGASVNNTILEGQTALHIASILNTTSIMSNLVKYGAFINAQDDEGDTPMHWAIRAQNYAAVELLLNQGASVNISNDDGETPLHLAALLGDDNVVQLLLDSGASTDDRDIDGSTPLHHAFDEKIARRLVDNGATINAKDADGQTPVERAMEMKKVLLMDYFISIGARDSSRFSALQVEKSCEGTKQGEKTKSTSKDQFVHKAFSRVLGTSSTSFIDV